MAFKIGFTAESGKKSVETVPYVARQQESPRRSVVQVQFPGRGMPLAYYNDRFDLHRGDRVYVDGKLEGVCGIVTKVNYSFKIKLSDYKRVIAVADTAVHGTFYGAGNYFVTFDRSALPLAKVRTWYLAPATEEEEFVCGSDDGSAFRLDDLKGMGVDAGVAERGYDYYVENRVRFFCLDGAKGYAIVEGRKPYEVEFETRSGEIRNLTCPCFCNYPCKHQFAAMLQLKETLDWIAEHYKAQYEESDYFAAVAKSAFFSFAVDGTASSSFTLG